MGTNEVSSIEKVQRRFGVQKNISCLIIPRSCCGLWAEHPRDHPILYPHCFLVSCVQMIMVHQWSRCMRAAFASSSTKGHYGNSCSAHCLFFFCTSRSFLDLILVSPSGFGVCLISSRRRGADLRQQPCSAAAAMPCVDGLL